MLAAASIGAIWSSTSPDFGINVSNLAACAPSLRPRQTPGWWIQVTDGFCSLQSCCHLLAQPSAPWLFQLHQPARPGLSLLIFSSMGWVPWATRCWDIFRWALWSRWAFVILNMQMSSSATELSEVWLFFPNPAPGCSATLRFPHSNFFAKVSHPLPPFRVSSAPTLVGLFHNSEEFHANITNLMNSF